MTDSDTYEATKGLSVYNALKLGGPMLPQQIARYLRAHWDPHTSDQYVTDGIAFLAEKGWIAQQGSGHLCRLSTGMIAVRKKDTDRDLVLITATP